VTKAAIESIADMLGMPYIRALEVATFYTQFQLNPVGTQARMFRSAAPHPACCAVLKICSTSVPFEDPPRTVSSECGRNAVVGGGGMPRRLRECADGDDLQGHL
jgi:hypothetical protein